MKLYDKNAVAKFLDMTPKNVERLTEKGVLQTVGNTKLYQLSEAARSYIRYLRDRGTDTDGAVDLNEERARLTKAKRMNEELDLAAKRGELHRAEDVQRIMSATLPDNGRIRRGSACAGRKAADYKLEPERSGYKYPDGQRRKPH